jgi:Spy/CpxP family protein refolding chaperone
MKTRTLVAGVFALGVAAATAAALAQGPGQGPGYGPGYGPGAGMMGGYGSGPGSGMMGGYGRGPGFGAGDGRGFGYGGGLAALDLSSEQREKIAALQEENRRKNWDTMGQMRSEQFKLRRMYYADKVDPAAVAEQQKKVDELRRQMLKSRVESHNQIAAVLTPEQRKQFRQYGPWWLREEDEE